MTSRVCGHLGSKTACELAVRPTPVATDEIVHNAVPVRPAIDSMVCKHDVIHKTGSRPTQHIVTPSDEDRATATGDMHKNGEVQPHGFRVMQADRPTHKQTDKS